MKNRLYDCICVFILLVILQSLICHAKIVNNTHRTKREISVAKTSQSKGDSSYAKQINSEHEEKGDDDSEEGNTYRDNTKGKRKVSRKATDSVISVDLHSSNVEGSFDRDDVSRYLNSRRSSEEPEEADEEATARDKNEEMSNLLRLPRNINGDRYTDQDERSSLYDDYEAKDIAKRGALSGPEDYEEIEEDDSPGISEDIAAVQDSMAEVEKKEKDARVKRDQAEISEMLDTSKSSPDDPVKLKESKIAAKDPNSRDVSSRIELLKGFNEASAPKDASKIKGFGSKDPISRVSDSSKIQEPTSKVTLPKKDESNVEYEKRVEEEIQRKIDSLKEEIRRNIEVQKQIRDIEDNNARFDELQDQEHEDEERQNFKDKLIEKRQIVAKRSIREIVDDTAGSSQRNEKKRSLRRELHKKRQHRSSEIGKSNTSKENENLKKRFVTNHDKSSELIPSKGLFKKKRERVRQIFLVNNDQHQAKKRQSRGYTLPSDRTAVGSENELFMNPDSSSYLRTDNKMLQVSLPVGEDENNEEEQSPTAEHSDSLVSLTGSSQELSPRLQKEYKEAFGGLQSEPGNALARFKRIKRVLAGPNAKI
ncbi:trichohyalin-like [Temnothorax curvispinosus]|uniref:Trichohyalin-like n=1 Tax=Temnothorax curvispinosus TaxID=300111 RepID=A0A6J1Q2M1_9HYME|nr:trichohyalin-like [Temnothorax curvispinosus]